MHFWVQLESRFKRSTLRVSRATQESTESPNPRSKTSGNPHRKFRNPNGLRSQNSKLNNDLFFSLSLFLSLSLSFSLGRLRTQKTLSRGGPLVNPTAEAVCFWNTWGRDCELCAARWKVPVLTAKSQVMQYSSSGCRKHLCVPMCSMPPFRKL